MFAAVSNIVQLFHDPLYDPIHRAFLLHRQCPQALVVVAPHNQNSWQGRIVILPAVHEAIVHADRYPDLLLLVRSHMGGELTPRPCTQCLHQLLKGKWVTSCSYTSARVGVYGLAASFGFLISSTSASLSASSMPSSPIISSCTCTTSTSTDGMLLPTVPSSGLMGSKVSFTFVIRAGQNLKNRVAYRGCLSPLSA